MNKGFRNLTRQRMHKYAAGSNQPIEAWPPVADTDLSAVSAPAQPAAAPLSVPDPDGLDAYDRRLADYMGKPTYVSQLRKMSKRKTVLDEMSFARDLLENWYVYALLLVSACFTGMLGVYMGLAPTRMPNGDLVFHTDGAHLLLAVAYGVSFVVVTECAFALGKWLFYIREIDNPAQAVSAVSIMAVAGVAILGTGIAGGIVIASTVDFLSAFVSIPEWAQYWVVRAIPVLILFNSVALTVYKLASTKAEAYRLIRAKRLEHDLDHEAQLNTMRQWAEWEINKAGAKLFVDKVLAGHMTAAEAIAKMEADQTLTVPPAGASRPTNGGRRTQ